jgi:hypothetical protein
MTIDGAHENSFLRNIRSKSDAQTLAHQPKLQVKPGTFPGKYPSKALDWYSTDDKMSL